MPDQGLFCARNDECTGSAPSGRTSPPRSWSRYRTCPRRPDLTPAGGQAVDTAVRGGCAQCQDGRMTQRRVSARIGGISESATLAVDAKAKALKAAGRPVIGFAAGEPDFPTPEPIVQAAIAAASDPKNHRYTPAAGLPELREVIAAKTK